MGAEQDGGKGRADVIARALVVVAIAAVTWIPVAAHAQNPVDEEPGGWYAGVGARVLKLESWQEGYAPSLLIGWKLPYQHSETPRSSVALEGEFTGTTEPLSRRDGDDGREEADILQGGVYLALNTFLTDRLYHRVRMGGVVRELDADSTRLQGRAAFGLGAGVRVTERLDLLADVQTQFWGWPDNLLYEGGVTARWHF